MKVLVLTSRPSNNQMVNGLSFFSMNVTWPISECLADQFFFDSGGVCAEDTFCHVAATITSGGSMTIYRNGHRLKKQGSALRCEGCATQRGFHNRIYWIKQINFSCFYH